MKQKEIIVGVILIIAGAILFFVGQSYIDNAWYSFPYVQDAIARGNIFRIIGMIVLIVGITATIIGVNSKDKGRKTLQQVKNRYCPSCDRTIPFDARICPYCKKDFGKI
jgi:uncharacterized membrane protein